ncbi:MAG: hypothetical protein NTY47_06625 [Candidatus Omnitrophica bacterium]|nr:hypothetical protein [Candidatus Omnitrophota bacterium]
MLFIFIRQIFFSNAVAFFSASLFSFVPYYFIPNTFGKEHGMALFFMLLAFSLVLSGIRNNSCFILAVSALIYCVSVAVRESVLTVLPFYALLFFSPRISFKPFRISTPGLKLKYIFYFFGVLFSVLGAMYLIYLKNTLWQAIFVRDYASVNFSGIISISTLRALNDLLMPNQLLLAIFVIPGIFLMMRRENNKFWPIFFLSLMGLFFYFANTTSYTSRYLDIAAIPVYIFTSYSIWGIFQKNKRIAIAILFFLLINMFLFMLPMLNFRHHYNGEKRFAEFVNRATPAGSIIVTMDDAPFIEYYGKRAAITHPIDDAAKISEFIFGLRGYLDRGRAVYLSGSGFSYDPKKIFFKAINENFNLNAVGSALCEDYHRPELGFQLYRQQLYKLTVK